MHPSRRTVPALLVVLVGLLGLPVLGLAAAPAFAADPSVLRLNELKDGPGDQDWVEIYNPADTAVSLTGVTVDLALSLGSPAVSTQPLDGAIPAHGYLTVDLDLTPVPNGDVVLRAGAATVDSLWVGYSRYTTRSAGRCADGSAAWVQTNAPTPGAPNDCSIVLINEVKAAAPGQPGWVELINTSAVPAKLDGTRVENGYDAADLTGTLAPGAVLAVDLASSDFYHYGYQSLLGIPDDSVKWGAGTSLPATSWARCPDGTGSADPDNSLDQFVVSSVATKGHRNCTFLEVAPPSVSGSGRVGEPLTVVTGTYDPSPAFRYFAWYVGGELKSGGPTYTPTPADAGKEVWVSELASSTGYADLRTDSAHITVLPGVITNTAPPVITGTAQAYGTLSVSPGEWSPADVDLGYQWYADGTLVPGATGATLDLGPADLGRAFTVRVTASRTGYDPVTVETDPVGPVAECALRQASGATIRGSAAVGETLEASPGVWVPDPDSVGYQWYADGAAIDGATGATYTLTSAELGKRITVALTVSKAACGTRTDLSAATPEVASGAFHVLSRPTIHGDPVVGGQLTVTGGAWNAEPAATSYQWVRGGQPIPGATDASYTPTGDDVGAWLAVQVTVSRDGYSDGDVTTPAVGPVRAGAAVSTGPPVIGGTPRAGRTLTATDGSWSFTPDRVAFQWYADGRPIAGATDDALVLDDASLVHQRISVRATASATGYPDVSAFSDPSDPVTKAPVVLTRTLSTRTPTVGSTRITVDVTVVAPDGLPVAGHVRVLVDGDRVAAADLDGDGSARLTLPVFDRAGRHKVVVRYGGTALLRRAAVTTHVHARN